MKACICVVAWHLNQELLESVASLPDVDVYVLSHQPQASLPAWLYGLIPGGRVFVEPNLGYDWGAYQQFIQKGAYQDYELAYFAHDDITLLNSGLFDLCAQIIFDRGGYCVVGNGRPTFKHDWPRTHIQCYAHSTWKPPSWDFCHDTVRGSFLATSRQAIDRIGHFEVFWDRRKLFGVGAGNWSLRATCGKMQALFGERTFHYLSEEYRSSPFLLEQERGTESYRKTSLPLFNRYRYKAIVILSRWLMTRYMNAPSLPVKQAYSQLMGRIFSII
jgi:hypothetical protein